MKVQKKPKHGIGIYLSPRKNKILVSVIIPTFNRGLLLIKALDSILKQTFKDFEVLIVDDGSTDNTLQLVKEFNDPRLKIIKKKHGGQASAINLGIKNARGEYICFCDDDDEYLPNKLKLCLEFLENNRQYDACYSAFYFRLPTGKIILKKYIHHDDFFFEKFFSKGFLFINSMFFKRLIFEKIGNFNENINIGNDYDLLLRMLAKGYTFGYVDTPTVFYNKHDSSMTSDRKFMYSVISLLKKNFGDFENSINPTFRKKILSNIIFREGKYYFWQKDFSAARKLFIKSIATYPLNKRPYFFLPFSLISIVFFNRFINFYQKITGNYYIRDCN